MKIRAYSALLCALLASACRKDADDPLSSNHGTIARTVTGDLTVARLDSLLVISNKKIERTSDNGVAFAHLWSNYQRFAYTAAHDDTLSTVVDSAIQPLVDRAQLNLFLRSRDASAPVDTATQEKYESATYDLVAIRNIFFAYPAGANRMQQDSVKRLAATVRPQLNRSNFGAMAARYSNEQASSGRGGVLGVLVGSRLDRWLYGAIKGLKPDSISLNIAGPSGVNIVQRMSYADIKPAYAQAYQIAAAAARDTQAIDVSAARADLTLEKDALARVRSAVLDPYGAGSDTTTIASYNRDGAFNVRQFTAWMASEDPVRFALLSRSIRTGADTLVTSIIERTAGKSILLRSADSARIAVPAAERTGFRDGLKTGVADYWTALGVSPQSLRTDGATPEARTRIATGRIERLIDDIAAGKAGAIPVPLIISRALNSKYKAVISTPAIKKWALGQ